MQYIINMPVAYAHERFTRLVEAEDASAVIDVNPVDRRTVRASTCLSSSELQMLAGAAGMHIGPDAIEHLPSDCSGSRGG